MRQMLESMQSKYRTAIDERERYFDELIKIKMSQAQILDEANRVHDESKRKIREMEETIKKIKDAKESEPVNN